MQDWQQRVIEEKTALDIKIKDLRKFIEENELFFQLDEQIRKLLLVQFSGMLIYLDALNGRINLFKD